MTKDDIEDNWKFNTNNNNNFPVPLSQPMININDMQYYGHDSFTYYSLPNTIDQSHNYIRNEYTQEYSPISNSFKSFGIKEHLYYQDNTKELDKHEYNQYNAFPMTNNDYQYGNIMLNDIKGTLPTENQDINYCEMSSFQSSNNISIQIQPSEHQVKECLIVPHPVLKVLCEPKSCDYITAYLVCDKRMNHDDIFLAAHSARFYKNVDIIFDNLKITNKMLKGRTKGYDFRIRFDYMSQTKVCSSIYSKPFNLWTNVRQKGFPREKRESYYSRWKDCNFQQ